MANVRLGTMNWQLGLDQGQFQQGLANAEGQVRSFGEKTSGSFSALTVAAGTLLAQGVMKLASGLQTLAGSAIQATANYQQMQVGLEGLLAREIARGEEATRTTQVVVKGKKAELDKIAALQVAYDDYAIKLDKARYHLAEISKTQGPGDIDFRTYANDVADYEQKLAATQKRMEALRGTSDTLATVTEKYWINQTTIGEALPEAQKQAKGLMDELSRIAILSPYQVENVQQTFKMAMAYGYTSDEAKKFTSAILNVAAGVGASNDMLDRMAYNFAQIRMQGKVTAVDMRQLAMAGFDLNGVLKSVGDQFGVTINSYDDFNKAIASGKITWEQFTDGFAKYADENFGGASERMAKTLNGLKSTFKDIFVLTFPKLLGPAAEHVTGFLQDILDGFLKIRETGILDEIGAKIGVFVGGVVGHMDDLRVLPKVIQDLASTDPRNLAELNDILSQLPEGLRGVAEGGAELLNAFQEGGLGGAIDFAKPLVANLLTDLEESAVDLWQGIQAWVHNAFYGLLDWWDQGGGGELVTGTIERIGAWIRETLSQLGTTQGDVQTSLYDWIGQLWGSFRTWWDAGGGELVISILEAIGQLLLDIIAGLWQMSQNYAAALLEWASELWGNISLWWTTGGEEQTAATVEAVGEWIAGVLVELGAKLVEWGGKLGEWAGQLWGNVSAYVTANQDQWALDLGNLIGVVIGKLVDFLFIQLPIYINQLYAWWSSLWEGGGAGNSFVDTLLGAAGDFAMGLSEFTGKVIMAAFFAIYENSEVVQSAVASVVQFFEKLKAGVDWVKALPDQGKAAIQGLLNGILAKAADALATVAKFVTDNIKGAVNWLTFLVQTGRDIAIGLFNGIEAMKDWFIGKIIAWAKSVIPEPLWKFFGIASPSLLMMQIGIQLVQGLIAGIEGMTPDAVERLSETMNALMGAISTALGALTGLGTFTAVADLGAKIAAFIEQVKLIVAELTELAGFYGGTRLDNIAKALEPLSGIFGTLQSVMQPIIEMGQTALPTEAADNIARIIDLLAETVPALVTALAEATEDIPADAMVAAALLAETMWMVAESLLPTLEAIEAAGELSGVDVSGTFIWIASQVKAMVLAFADLLDPDFLTLDDLKQAQEVASYLSDIVAPVKAMVSALEALAAYRATDVTEAATDLIYQVFGLARLIFSQIENMPVQLLKDAGEVAELISAVMKPWKDAIAAVAALAAYRALDISAQAVALIEQTLSLVKLLASLQQSPGLPALRQAAAVAELVTAALKPWKDAIAAVKAISEYSKTIIGGGPNSPLAILADQIFGLVRKMANIGAWLDEGMLQDAATTAGKVTTALAPWIKAIDTIIAISEYSRVAIGGAGSQLELLADQIFGLVRKMANIGAWLDEGMLDDAAEVAGKIVVALAPWEKAIAAVKAIAAYTPKSIGGGPTSQLAILAEQIFGLVRKMANIGKQIGASALALAAAVAGQIVAALAPWEKAIKAVEAIADYKPSVIGPNADALIDAMYDLAKKLVERGKRIGLDRLAFAGKVGKLFGEVLAPWEKAIKLADALRMWRIVPDLADRFEKLLTFVTQMVDDLIEAARKVDQDGLAAAVEFAAALDTLMISLQTALELALSMPAQWAVDPGVWDAFTGWVMGTFEAFYDWATDTTTLQGGIVVPAFTEDGIATTSAIITALDLLMNALATAMALALGLPATWSVDPTVWSAFTDWTQSTFQGFYDWATGETVLQGGVVVPTFTEDGIATTSALIAALDMLMNALATAMATALAIPSEWDVDPEVWSAFTGWTQTTFQGFYDWATGETVLQGGVVVPTFTEDGIATTSALMTALDTLMSALSTALGLALALPATWTVDTAVWNAFAGWVQGVFLAFNTWVTTNFPTPEDPEAPDQFGAITGFGAALSALMGGLGSALELAANFPTSQSWPTGEVWTDFVTWIETVMTTFVTYVTEQLDPATGEGPAYDAVEAFGSAMSSVFGGLISALALFEGLQGWVGPNSVLEARLGLFLTEVLARMQQIATFVAENMSEGDIITLTGAFGDALTAVVGGLHDALDLFKTIADTDPAVYTDSQQFRDRVGNLILAIAGDGTPQNPGLLGAIHTYLVTPMQTAWLEEAQDFFDAVDGVIELLGDALDLFVEIDEHGLPNPVTISAFLTAVLNLFAQFAAGLAGPTGAGTLASAILGDLASLVAGIPATLAPYVAQFNQAGHDLMRGLAQGMWGEQWFLLQTVTQISDAMIQALRERLGIASPSRVFKSLGQLTGKGLSLGLLDSLPAIDQAMNRIGDSLTPAWAIDPEVGFTKTLIVEFRGQGAAGASPLPPTQFDMLKRELIWELQRGG